MENNILFDEAPLVVSPQLAKILGLNEAIILQQLHYWLRKKPKIKDNRAWIYNSISNWQVQFPFFSVNTIRRTLDSLVASNIIIKGDYNKTTFDKTSWWAIDYEGLNAIAQNHKSICPKWANGYTQNGRMDLPKMGEPIPETNTETNKKEKEKKKTAESGQAATPATSKRFVKPTLEEVTTYCQEQKNNVNPQIFIDHYTSNGWKVGKVAMRDWKAAVRNWARRDKEKPERTKKAAPLFGTERNYTKKEIDNLLDDISTIDLSGGGKDSLKKKN